MILFACANRINAQVFYRGMTPGGPWNRSLSFATLLIGNSLKENLNLYVSIDIRNLPEKAASWEQAVAEATEIFVMATHVEYKKLAISDITGVAGPNPLVVDPWFL